MVFTKPLLRARTLPTSGTSFATTSGRANTVATLRAFSTVLFIVLIIVLRLPKEKNKKKRTSHASLGCSVGCVRSAASLISASAASSALGSRADTEEIESRGGKPPPGSRLGRNSRKRRRKRNKRKGENEANGTKRKVSLFRIGYLRPHTDYWLLVNWRRELLGVRARSGREAGSQADEHAGSGWLAGWLAGSTGWLGLSCPRARRCRQVAPVLELRFVPEHCCPCIARGVTSGAVENVFPPSPFPLGAVEQSRTHSKRKTDSKNNGNGSSRGRSRSVDGCPTRAINVVGA